MPDLQVQSTDEVPANGFGYGSTCSSSSATLKPQLLSENRGQMDDLDSVLSDLRDNATTTTGAAGGDGEGARLPSVAMQHYSSPEKRNAAPSERFASSK